MFPKMEKHSYLGTTVYVQISYILVRKVVSKMIPWAFFYKMGHLWYKTRSHSLNMEKPVNTLEATDLLQISRKLVKKIVQRISSSSSIMGHLKIKIQCTTWDADINVMILV
jgi:hypothetical protein